MRIHINRNITYENLFEGDRLIRSEKRQIGFLFKKKIYNYIHVLSFSK